MERVNVVSSNVISVGWSPEGPTLEVEFQGGSIYQYENVPEDIYQGLLAAESVGKYLNQNIKGTYSYRKIS